MTGAAIGGSVGRVVTGEGGVSDVAGSAMKAKHLAHLGKISKAQQATKLTGLDKSKLGKFLDDKNLTPEMKKETMEAFEKAGINNLSDDELAKQFEQISGQGDMEGNFAESFAKGVSDNRKSKAVEFEKDLLFPGRVQQREQTKAVLSDTGMSPEMVDSTMNALDRHGLQDVSSRELHTQHHKLKGQGDLSEGYAETFANGISNERKSAQLQKEKRDVYGEVEYELHMNKKMITNELANKGLPPEMINQTLDTLKSHGIENISGNEMKRHFDVVVEKAEQGEWKNGFAKTFVSNIENERNAIELEKERKALLKGNNLKSFDDIPK